MIFLKIFLDEYLQVRPKSTVLSHYHDRGFLASQSRVPALPANFEVKKLVCRGKYPGNAIGLYNQGENSAPGKPIAAAAFPAKNSDVQALAM